jgi:hypothetical protein
MPKPPSPAHPARASVASLWKYVFPFCSRLPSWPPPSRFSVKWGPALSSVPHLRPPELPRYPTRVPPRRLIVCTGKSCHRSLFFLVHDRCRQFTPAANLPHVQVERVPGVLQQPPEPPLLPSLHQSRRTPLPRRRQIHFLGELGHLHLPILIHVLWCDPHTLLFLHANSGVASHLTACHRSTLPIALL